VVVLEVEAVVSLEDDVRPPMLAEVQVAVEAEEIMPVALLPLPVDRPVQIPGEDRPNVVQAAVTTKPNSKLKE
jgi:hypothetical protein